MIGGQLAKFEGGKHILPEFSERSRERGAGAVGVAENQAALFDELLELDDSFIGKIEQLVAGDVENGGIVPIADGRRGVDDLPIEIALELARNPSGEISGVAR